MLENLIKDEFDIAVVHKAQKYLKKYEEEKEEENLRKLQDKINEAIRHENLRTLQIFMLNWSCHE
jgi:uncharacterized membrane protein (DUF106 family)